MSCPRLLAATSLGLLGSCVFTSERPVAVDVKADLASAYLLRGQVMTDRPVFQPSTAVHMPVRGGGTASFTAWGNLDLSDSTGDAWFDGGHAGEFTEIDLTAAYQRRVGELDVAIGLLSYTWPNEDAFPFQPFPSTAEVFASVAGDVVGFTPSFAAHYDIDEVEGLYLRAELLREFALSRDVAIVLEGGLGWSNERHSQWLYRTKTNALADADLRAAVIWQADDVTSVDVGVRASTIVDDQLRDWFRGKIDPDNVWFTAGVGWAF